MHGHRLRRLIRGVGVGLWITWRQIFIIEASIGRIIDIFLGELDLGFLIIVAEIVGQITRHTLAYSPESTAYSVHFELLKGSYLADHNSPPRTREIGMSRKNRNHEPQMPEREARERADEAYVAGLDDGEQIADAGAYDAGYVDGAEDQAIADMDDNKR